VWYIIVLAGLPSHRWSRVTSNVKAHQNLEPPPLVPHVASVSSRRLGHTVELSPPIIGIRLTVRAGAMRARQNQINE